MSLAASETDNIRQGFPPTREDLFWVETMRQVYTDSMTRAHHVATLMLILAGAGTLGILFWSLISGAVARSRTTWQWIPIIVPCVLWGVSSVYGLRTFLIRRYRYFANSPDSSRLAFKRIVRRKIRNAVWSFVFWLAGVGALLIAMLAVRLP